MSLCVNGDDDLICLSSDEEEMAPRTSCKRKLTGSTEEISKISKKASKNETTKTSNGSVICLDSDDSQEAIVSKCEEKLETKTTTTTELPNGDSVEKGSNKGESDSEKNNFKDQIKTDGTKKKTKSANSLDASSRAGSSKSSVHKANKGMENLPEEAVIYLKTCREHIENTKFTSVIEKKFPPLVKIFHSMANDLSNSRYLKKYLQKQTQLASKSLISCMRSFKEVYDYFKNSYECEGIELSKSEKVAVKKLKKAIREVTKKMKELDEQEIDFDADENDSPYIKQEVYARRLIKLNRMYCLKLKKSYTAGRLTYERVDFVSSQHSEINLAICKKYKNNKIFPSYDEIHTLIKNVVQDNKLPLTDTDIKAESTHCFKALGDLLQIRRKKELFDVHCDYILDKPDPAASDKELDAKLRENAKVAKTRIDKVLEEFVKKQEMGVNDEEIDCSDQSDEECSESEDDEEEEGDC